jgi:hypothetical protein
MNEYATDVIFYKVYILISWKKNQVGDKAIVKTKAYAKNVYQESMMHYHKENQYVDIKCRKEMQN